MEGLKSRRLILHIGIPKTGSSAIQRSLVLNRDGLRECGVIYPEHRSDARLLAGLAAPGNGAALVKALNSDSGEREAFARLDSKLERHWREGRTVLISAEGLWDVITNPRQGELLSRYACARGIEMRIVVYLRDVVGHSRSRYAQYVERRGYAGSYAQYIGSEVPDARMGVNADRRYFLNPGERVECLIEIFGDSAVRLAHYDLAKSSLVNHFYEGMLGISETFPSSVEPQMQVNRTLSGFEINLVRRYNLRFCPSDAESRRLSDVVSRTLLGGADKPPVTVRQQDVDYLEGEFGHEIGDLRDRFPSLANLRIGVADRTRSAVSCEEHTQGEETLLAWLHASVASE